MRSRANPAFSFVLRPGIASCTAYSTSRLAETFLRARNLFFARLHRRRERIVFREIIAVWIDHTISSEVTDVSRSSFRRSDIRPLTESRNIIGIIEGNNMSDETTNDPKKNPDPCYGRAGFHPVGTGVGTTGGGLAGAVIGGAIGGPVGAVVGAAVGGVAGAYGGRGVAETVNPTQEEAYWRENHPAQTFTDENYTFENYAPAYRAGYEGVTKYAGKKYEEIEDDLALDYEKNRADSALPWDQARHAARAAWSKSQPGL